MGQHRGGLGAVDVPDQAALAAHPCRLSCGAHVGNADHLPAQLLQAGDAGGGNADPEIFTQALAAPLGAQRLRHVPVAGPELGNRGFFAAAVLHVAARRAGVGKQRLQHGPHGVGKGHACGALLHFQQGQRGVFAHTGQASQADDFGFGWWGWCGFFHSLLCLFSLRKVAF